MYMDELASIAQWLAMACMLGATQHLWRTSTLCPDTTRLPSRRLDF